jgi:hypothetical protein
LPDIGDQRFIAAINDKRIFAFNRWKDVEFRVQQTISKAGRVHLLAETPKL